MPAVAVGRGGLSTIEPGRVGQVIGAAGDRCYSVGLLGDGHRVQWNTGALDSATPPGSEPLDARALGRRPLLPTRILLEDLALRPGGRARLSPAGDWFSGERIAFIGLRVVAWWPGAVGGSFG